MLTRRQMGAATLLASAGVVLGVGCTSRKNRSVSDSSSSSATSSRAGATSSTSSWNAAPGPALPSAPGTTQDIPPVSTAQAAVGFIDVRSVVPDAILDLRYATTNNFTHTQLYPSDARCLTHESMGPGLTTAADRLRRLGYRIVFWDGYRPHSVQVKMFQVVPDPAWVAKPGNYSTSHESGRSVDITLASSSTGRYLDMGTNFDDFTDRAHAYATDVSATARRNRKILRDAMAAGGLSVYSGEWWHFDGAGSGTHRPVIDVPVN